MTEEQIQMTMDIANRILADSTASEDRKAWASDAIAALDFGDLAAARRLGILDAAKERTQ